MKAFYLISNRGRERFSVFETFTKGFVSAGRKFVLKLFLAKDILFEDIGHFTFCQRRTQGIFTYFFDNPLGPLGVCPLSYPKLDDVKKETLQDFPFTMQNSFLRGINAF